MNILGYHPSAGETLYNLALVPLGALLLATIYFLARKFRGLSSRLIAASSGWGRRWVISKLEQRLARCVRAAAGSNPPGTEATLALGRALKHGIKGLFMLVGAICMSLMGAATSIIELLTKIEVHGFFDDTASIFVVLSLLLYGMAIAESVTFTVVTELLSDFERPDRTALFLRLRIEELKSKGPAPEQ